MGRGVGCGEVVVRVSYLTHAGEVREGPVGPRLGLTVCLHGQGSGGLCRWQGLTGAMREEGFDGLWRPRRSGEPESRGTLAKQRRDISTSC